MSKLPAIEQKLKEAFALVADLLVVAGYSERVRTAYELLDANESAIALEIMCENLHEFECRIPGRAYELFAEAGANLKVNSEYWEILKPYVVK